MLIEIEYIDQTSVMMTATELICEYIEKYMPVNKSGFQNKVLYDITDPAGFAYVLTVYHTPTKVRGIWN